MNLKLFDSHCHLQLPQFDADRQDMITRMLQRTVGAVVVGTDLQTSKAGLQLAKKYDFLSASVGLHPNDNLHDEFDLTNFQQLALDPKVVAIGECGLDYFRSSDTEEQKMAQKKRFEQQIELALTVQKPLIIHCRNAHDDMLTILEDYMGHHPQLRVVIHFFTGSAELAKKYLVLGCFLSFPGPITYTDMYDESIRETPLDRILSETDSPFAAPVPFRGKRNEPVYVEYVVKKIAALKDVSFEEVSRQIVLNSQGIFGLQ